MSVDKMLAGLRAAAEATAKANHGKAKAVESEDFSPLSSAIGKVKAVEAEEAKPKAKAKKKTAKPKAKAEQEEEEAS